MRHQQRDAPTNYKTILCENWQNGGACKYGSNCTFAHGKGELRQASGFTDASRLSTGLLRPKDPPANYKTILCENWQNEGSCKYGSNCTFAHGKGELQLIDRQNGPRPTAREAAGNYKTVLCENWQTEGSCRYGSNCTFAHGPAELLPPGLTENGVQSRSSVPLDPQRPPPPNYKTVLCDNWQNGATCKYGANCTFAHGKEELQEFPTYPDGSRPPRTQVPPRHREYPLSRKTTLCENWQNEGCCKFGTNCRFAHGKGELHQALELQSREQASRQLAYTRSAPAVLKTVLCENWQTDGCCKFGSACRFAHGKGELHQRTYEETFQPLDHTPPLPRHQHHADSSTVNYKTSLCENWLNEGSCKFEASCTFAHGTGELRHPPETPKYDGSAVQYKTVLCENWLLSGCCRYGSGCTFAHGKGELQSAK